MMLNNVEIITTGDMTNRVNNENDLLKLLGNDFIKSIRAHTGITLKRSTVVNSTAFDYRTLFEVAIDVIDSLLNDQVTGVVLIIERETMSELAFYLSLFTHTYQKPIIICPLPENLFMVESDENMIAMSLYEQLLAKNKYLKTLQEAIKFVVNNTDRMLEPLTFIENNIYGVTDDTQCVQVKVDQLEMETGMFNDTVYEEKMLTTNKILTELIGDIPVIPEKIAFIRLCLGMDGQEVLNIVKHYVGAVIEIAHDQKIHPTIEQAIQKLTSFQIPVIIVYNDHKSFSTCEQSLLSKSDAFVIRRFPGEHARLLLGVMVAQKMSWEKMKKVCAMIR